MRLFPDSLIINIFHLSANFSVGLFTKASVSVATAAAPAGAVMLLRSLSLIYKTFGFHVVRFNQKNEYKHTKRFGLALM